MRFKVERDHFRVEPEGNQDEAFIEDTLQMRVRGDAVLLVREDAFGVGNAIAYLRTKPCPVESPWPTERAKLVRDIADYIDACKNGCDGETIRDIFMPDPPALPSS